MILAELEVFHSRAYSPTRRIALGHRLLPVDPPPGFGPLLLGGIIAVGADELDADDFDALLVLMAQLEHGQRIVQPRIRHRFQTDQHGLGRTVGRLVGGGETLEFDFDGHGSPLQMTLAATYAVGTAAAGHPSAGVRRPAEGTPMAGRDRSFVDHPSVGPARFSGVVGGRVS